VGWPGQRGESGIAHDQLTIVTPVKTGVHSHLSEPEAQALRPNDCRHWIPAFAGMTTVRGLSFCLTPAG
jgi:hypothetical protein